MPRRFRRARLLVLGCGDVGTRLARQVSDRLRVIGVVRRAESAEPVRAAGATPIVVDLDDARACRRLRGLAGWIVHSAPPPAAGRDDPRTRHAVAALAGARRWVYLGTSGVYGDCGGAMVRESRPIAPRNDRAVRRAAAERRLRRHARASGVRVVLLRVPGIYGADRLPIERLQRGTPALAEPDDVYTNHVHAEDLARIAFAALLRGRSTRVYHASDRSVMRMGEYFDAVADAFGLPRPPRLPREAVRAAVSPMLFSFMSESRRLSNERLERELRVRLRHPTVTSFLDSLTRD